MAQKVQIILEDDLDGTEASETVSFALDGTSYEIDLTAENAAEMRDAFARYVGHARKVSSSRRGSGRRASTGGAGSSGGVASPVVVCPVRSRPAGSGPKSQNKMVR